MSFSQGLTSQLNKGRKLITAIAVNFVSSLPIVLNSSNLFFSSTAAFILQGTGKSSGAAVVAMAMPMAIA